jgi:hypothetical protein
MNEQIETGSESTKVGNASDPEKKVVVVLNDKIDVGRLMNACAHLAMGFGASRGSAQRSELLL